jgi:hypothetical protein
MRVNVVVYRDNARVHCSTLGAGTFSIPATVAETPEFFDKVAGWLMQTFVDGNYPFENCQCEAKLVRVEDEKLEYDIIFKKFHSKREKVPGTLLMDVVRDEHGNVDYRMPPPKRTTDDSAN